MERNLSNASLSPSSSSKLRLTSATTNFKSTIQFNESSFMSKLKQMYEKRNIYRYTPFHIKKFKLSQSTSDTEDENNKKNKRLKIITRNQSEKLLVHPIFRQQQKYLTSKIQSPISTPKRQLHPIYLSPTSFKNINNNNTFHNYQTNNNSVIYDNANTTATKSPKNRPNIHKLLHAYITLVLKKAHKTKYKKQKEPSIYPYNRKQPTTQLNNQELLDKESQTPRYSNNNHNNFLLDKQIVDIFRKLPFPLQKQINEMLHLKIHIKYCENMFDLLNRKLDIRDNTNNPISDNTAIESNLYNEMIDFIYQHKTNYSKHNDFTITKEITPENMYIQSIKEKHKQLYLDVLKNKDNTLKKVYSSKNELIDIRNKRKMIQDKIDKGMIQRKVKEKEIRETNKKRLNYFLIKEKDLSQKQIKNTQRNIKTIEVVDQLKKKTLQPKSNLKILTKINNNQIHMKQFNYSSSKMSANNQINNTNNNNSTILKKKSIIQKYSKTNINTNNIINSNNNTITTCCVNEQAMSERPQEIIQPEKIAVLTNDDEEQKHTEYSKVDSKFVEDNKIKYQRQQKAKQTLISQIDDAVKKKEENDLCPLDKEMVDKMRQNYENEHKRIRVLHRKKQTLLEPRVLNLANNKKLYSKNYFLEGNELDKEYKMKELKAFKLSQEINYFLSIHKPRTENEKNLFEEFKEKINSLKQANDEIYISYINDNYDYLQEELENLRKIKEREKQINEFIFHLNNDIQNNSLHRALLGDMIRFKDTGGIGKEFLLNENDNKIRGYNSDN